MKLEKLFRLNDRPLVLSPKQREIFDCIVDIDHPRVQIIAPTQYGKSLTVALGVLTAACGFGEKFTILAPSEKKASIIMGYVIDHCFDSNVFLDALELDQNTSLDRLRRERSRNHITFRGGGGVQTLTLDARNAKRSLEAAMGFGGNRLVLDESSLIDDPLYSTVKRMLGGYSYTDTFLLEIGNPFYRNHFLRTWNNSYYQKIFIDYQVGLSEGRYSPEFIEEMKSEAFFDVYYACKFPEADAVDIKGYRFLITDEDYIKAIVDELKPDGEPKLGCDIGGGGDFNVFTVRYHNVAFVASKNQSKDTMSNVTEITNLMEQYKITPNNVFIDDIGIGRGVTDRLKEKGLLVNGVSVGDFAQDRTRYKNIKAEAFWNMRNWLVAGGKLIKHDGFVQLGWIKYKVTTDKVLQIEPKEELVQRTGKSPDYADSLMLTFVQGRPTPKISFL